MENSNPTWIQKVIEVSGVSLNEFGRRIGISGKTVSRWNRGVFKPSVSSAKKVRKAFNDKVNQVDEYFKIKNNE